MRVKQILIYPYSTEFESILVRLMKKYPKHSFTLAAPASWPLSVTTNESLSSRIKTVNDVKEIVYAELKTAQSVILLSCPTRAQMHEEIVALLREALKQAKKTICFESLSEEEIQLIHETDHSSQFKYYGKTVSFPVANPTVPQNQHLRRQECIVLGVAGLLRGMNTTVPLLELKDALEQSGYHVVSVSADTETQILGHILFPYQIIEKYAPAETQIRELNQYFCDLVERTGADVLLIQYPDGLMKYSDTCGEGFGVCAFMLSQALSMDYFILSVPYIETIFMNMEDFEEFQRSIKYRFGNEADAFLVEEKEVDDFLTREESQVVYRRIPAETVDILVTTAQARRCPVYSWNTLDSYQTIIENMVDFLSCQDEEY